MALGLDFDLLDIRRETAENLGDALLVLGNISDQVLLGAELQLGLLLVVFDDQLLLEDGLGLVGLGGVLAFLGEFLFLLGADVVYDVVHEFFDVLNLFGHKAL